MQKVSIEWLPKYVPKTEDEKINQIYSMGLEFAVASDTRQCCDFVYCKDFLQDTIWAVLHDAPVDIYQFKFNPKNNCFDVNGFTRILVANESDEFFHQKIPNCIDFINQIETVLHLKKTVAYQCENSPEKYLPSGVFMLKGSQRWMLAPPLMSMYTLLLRCGFVHEIGNDFMTTINKIISGEIQQYQTSDQEYLASSLAGIQIILKLGYRKIFYKDMKKNYPQNVSVSTLHHYCGIVAFSTGATKKTVPYWSREELSESLNGFEIKNLWINPLEK